MALSKLEKQTLKKVEKLTSLKIDWKQLEIVLEEYSKVSREARKLRRNMADWDYIESRPEPIKTALKILVETGDLKMVSMVYSIPLDVLNRERIKAKIPILL